MSVEFSKRGGGSSSSGKSTRKSSAVAEKRGPEENHPLACRRGRSVISPIHAVISENELVPRHLPRGSREKSEARARYCASFLLGLFHLSRRRRRRFGRGAPLSSKFSLSLSRLKKTQIAARIPGSERAPMLSPTAASPPRGYGVPLNHKGRPKWLTAGTSERTRLSSLCLSLSLSFSPRASKFFRRNNVARSSNAGGPFSSPLKKPSTRTRGRRCDSLAGLARASSREERGRKRKEESAGSSRGGEGRVWCGCEEGSRVLLPSSSARGERKKKKKLVTSLRTRPHSFRLLVFLFQKKQGRKEEKP